MNNETLDLYLHGLKFIVIADEKTRVPFEIFFGFDLPSMHSDIFEAAQRKYEKSGKRICVQGGGRITKKDNYIIFHGTSQKYKRYEDDVVLMLAPKNAFFNKSNFVFLSKAGEEKADKILTDFFNRNPCVK